MWRTRTWARTAVACLATCALLVAVPLRLVAAQQPASVSEELMAAILRYAFRYDGGNARVFHGRVPDDLAPNFYMPSGTRVLGSVVTGSSVLVLLTSTAPPESLRAEYARALAPRGWTLLESMRRGGFVDDFSRMPLILCRDGAQLHVTHARRTAGSSDLYLHYRDAPGPCEQPRPPAFRPMSEPQFPTLYAPPGGSGASGMRCLSRMSGGGRSMISTMVPGDTSAEEVLRHYARQIEAEGWRSAATGRAVATGVWTRSDTTGTTELRLQVRDAGMLGFRCYQVEMSVTDRLR